jgi:hypothetical protein
VFDGYSRIYTDGSKEDAAVAAAAVMESVVLVKRLLDHSSFSAEARTILLVLGTADQSTYDRFAVLCDSLSCLKGIQNGKIANYVDSGYGKLGPRTCCAWQ